jgi:hypothetical protein
MKDMTLKQRIAELEKENADLKQIIGRCSVSSQGDRCDLQTGHKGCHKSRQGLHSWFLANER